MISLKVILLLLTSDERTHHCYKTGKDKISSRNLCLHFLANCLKEKFKISQILVTSHTAEGLPINMVRSLKKKRLNFPITKVKGMHV